MCPRCSDTFSISFVIFICIVISISSLASRCSRGDSTSDYVIFTESKVLFVKKMHIIIQINMERPRCILNR